MITEAIKNKFSKLKSLYGILDRQYRQECLELIQANEGITVTEIYVKLKCEQSLASQALAELREKDLVTAVRDGKFRKYYPNKANIKALFCEELPKGETSSVIQVHAVMNFFFADHNISKYNLIRQAFPDIDIRDVHHLEERLEECNHSLFRFIEKIDEEKRGRLIRYIMENYNGVSVQTIQKRYF